MNISLYDDDETMGIIPPAATCDYVNPEVGFIDSFGQPCDPATYGDPDPPRLQHGAGWTPPQNIFNFGQAIGLNLSHGAPPATRTVAPQPQQSWSQWFGVHKTEVIIGAVVLLVLLKK
jgi:hypothetical protein